MNLIIIIRKTETFYLNIFTLDDTFAVAEQRNVKIAKKKEKLFWTLKIIQLFTDLI